MKTLGVLLLLAIGLGATYWTTQRPGEGVDALRDDARTVLGRVTDAVGAMRGRAPDATGAAAALPVASGAEPLDEASAALDTRIDALENELTRTMSLAESTLVLDRLDGVDARLARLGESNQADTDRSTDLQATLARLQQRLDALDPAARLDALDERLDAEVTALSEQLAAREQARVRQVDRQADRLAAEQAALAQRIDTTNARLATLVSPASDAEGTTADAPTGAPAAGAPAPGAPAAAMPVGIDAALDARLVAVEESLASSRATDARVDGLEARLESIGEQLSDRDQRTGETLARLENAVEALTTDNRALSIDSAQQQIRGQLSSLDAEMEGGPSAGDVGELTESLASTRQRLGELETQVRDLPASARAGDRVQQNQGALEQQVAALERRIERMSERDDPALASSLDEVREQVDQLSASGFVTQEELRAQAEGKHVEYKIYFDKNSTAVSAEAARVLDSFIAQETNRTTGVAIFGFTDRQGSAVYNQQLAQRRAASVRSYLIQNGFDYTKIGNVAGLGEDAAAALLEDDEEDAQQRVVVLFASQL